MSRAPAASPGARYSRRSESKLSGTGFQLPAERILPRAVRGVRNMRRFRERKVLAPVEEATAPRPY